MMWPRTLREAATREKISRVYSSLPEERLEFLNELVVELGWTGDDLTRQELVVILNNSLDVYLIEHLASALSVQESFDFKLLLVNHASYFMQERFLAKTLPNFESKYASVCGTFRAYCNSQVKEKRLFSPRKIENFLRKDRLHLPNPPG